MRKVTAMILTVLLMAAGSAYAGCGKCDMGAGAKSGQQASVDQSAGKMAADLKLTADQKVKVEAIMQAQKQKKQQLVERQQAETAALHEQLKAELKGVLSAEQMKKWDAAKKQCPMMGGMKLKGAHDKNGKDCPMGQHKK